MREFVLITLTGEDRPGLVPSLSGLLAPLGGSILDIRQSLFAGVATLNVTLAPDGDWRAALDSCQAKAAALGLQMMTHAADSAANAVGERYAVTLMARSISAEQLLRVSAIATEQGLQVEGIRQLSADVAAGRSALELALRGQLQDPQALREAFFAASQELSVDIACQRETLQRRHRRLAVFDMDSTLIEAEVIDELAKAAGVGEKVAEITERAMRGELDFRASFKERLGLLKGLSEDVLEGIGASLRLTEGTERLFAELKRLGYKTAILSGGFTYFARQLQAKLGIDYVFANELQIVDGQVTGVAVEPIVDAQRKADLLRELAEKEGLQLEQCIAVGDGANDLPMLALAGLGVAFRAKPLVRQSAKQAISTLGLDGVLYLLGLSDSDLAA